jgi:hypothetical protein
MFEDVWMIVFDEINKFEICQIWQLGCWCLFGLLSACSWLLGFGW